MNTHRRARGAGRIGRTLLAAVLVCLVSTVAAADARAVTREEARRQLEQAEEAARRLRDLADLTGGLGAADVRLDREIDLIEGWIERSREYYLSTTVAGYDRSYHFSGLALERARKVVAELRTLERKYRLSQRYLEQNREMLDLLRRQARLGPVGQKTARMLDMAVDTFQRSVEALDRGELVLAFKLMQQTNDLARKIVKSLGGERLSRERVTHDLDRTDEMIARAAEALGEIEAPEAGAVLERAQGVQEQAIATSEEGNFDFARRLTLRARTLARLSLRLGQGAPPTEAERILEHTDGLLEKYGVRIQESGDQGAIDLLEDAIALQAEAWDLFADDQTEAALAKTQAAAKLVNSAHRKISRGSP